MTYTKPLDPYGVVTHSSGLSHTDYGFTGESYSPSTQLTYLRARYYNPADGRFQSRDTWSGDVKRPLSLNRWGYVEGNPVNYTDPSGLSPSLGGGIDDLPVTLLDPRELGYYAGENVDLLPYLFYLDPNDFSFTAGVQFNDYVLQSSQISVVAKAIYYSIGQGGIFDEPGYENYPVLLAIEEVNDKTFWKRFVEVHGSVHNMFSAWFVVERIYGKNMVAETFPLTTPLGHYFETTVYLEPLTTNNRNSIVLDSKYFSYYQPAQYAAGWLEYLIRLSECGNLGVLPAIHTFPIPSDLMFNVTFTTRQTGERSMETKGVITLLRSQNPVGVITLRGSYSGEEWKLHVLDGRVRK